MVGRIYKITNILDGKSYIGQTIKPIDKRFLRHLSDSQKDDYYFHRALRKYGKENFIIECLEDNIDQEFLNERERYWIKYYNTYFKSPNSKGYNMTQGGDSLIDSIRILSDDDILEIKELLKNTDYFEISIAEKYNVSISAISDINRGKSWFDEKEKYPLRKCVVRELSYEDFLMIIEILQTNLFSLNYIEEKFNIAQSTISNINNKKYLKYEYPENLKFPLQSNKIVSNTKISTENTLLLLIDYFEETHSIKELAFKYKISEAYVKSIISHQNKNFLKDLKYPLKDNKNFNLSKIKEKLEIYNKYK